MLKFLKAQVASLSGTIVDFLTTLVSVELFHVWYVAANIAGNVCGGITNFYLGRNWVFNSRDKKVYVQGIRYIMVWGGSIALNTSGVFALTHFLEINYIISKVVVSLVVGFSYNYFLQNYFVFKQS
ncbi:GtrA family protein [Arcticibacter sp. MXS-1]|uniref:GtrA family protein n=1 Tax=Arcticibacter sp. MXS-1 TaxID=3341726 RepID=UPI0035A95C1A